ncbi:uncharacterized protein BXIN_2648 [Babesia sp. Xinjiang]|uniref:uncharacterized protein n=1 Tax=Babesia sp. Xinjiang TaxID=462227 RepID=UPI000A265F49|nr:uncharacterized protein BXIN_2673 [Babesia sp. Xinjiang]XP_028872062.1 uncharacterized protein BXIN_2648 [Babesia sp. Xinjiang]ORM41573.1 hypothetical protein BXIN_2673 [Babesia sp. Xinjiang]ORM41606.1 hypothetical protein BXIN_2648 [Babesia sp. Xinjiang]
MDAQFLQDKLQAISFIVPGNIDNERDVWEYIDRLTGPGDHLRSVLERSENTGEIIQDLLYLAEFEKQHRRKSGGEGRNGSLCYHIMRVALELETPAAAQLINRLYLRGFVKELVKAMLMYFGTTVSNSEKLDCDSVLGGLLKDSGTTLRICAHALKAMDRKIDVVDEDGECKMRFKQCRDYNVALRIVELFLESSVMKEENNYAYITRMFHPRSAVLLPIKMQFFVLHILARRIELERQELPGEGKEADTEPTSQPPVTELAEVPESQEETLDSDKVTTVEPENVPNVKTEGVREKPTLRERQLRSKDMPTNLFVAVRLLRKLSLMWSESVDQDVSLSSEFVIIAAGIVKLLEIVYSIDDELKSERFLHIELYLTQGIEAKLSSMDRNLSSASMYIASAMSKLVVRREELLGNDVDDVIDLDEEDCLIDDTLLPMQLASAPFVVDGIDYFLDGARGNAKPSDLIEQSIKETEEKLTLRSSKRETSDNYDKHHVTKLVNDIFADVPLVEFREIEPAEMHIWTDPPKHIQQCFERLCGTPVAADVEVSRLLNKALNKPRRMPNAAKRDMIAQTLLYLPRVVARDEPILDRFAVPVCQLLLKLDNLELYEEAFVEQLTKLRLSKDDERRVEDIRMWTELIGVTECSSVINIQAHLAHALGCIAKKRPLKVIQFFCQAIADGEYSIYQKLIMLSCMQLTAYHLSDLPECYIGKNIMARVLHMYSLVDKRASSENNARSRLVSRRRSPSLGRSVPKVDAKDIALRERQDALLKPAEIWHCGIVIGNDYDYRTKEERMMATLPSWSGSETTSSGASNRFCSSRESLFVPANNQVVQSDFLSRQTPLIEEIVRESDEARVEAPSVDVNVNPVNASAVEPSGEVSATEEVERRTPVLHISESNEFAPLANMAISYLVQAAERCIKIEEQNRTPTVAQLLVICMLDTLMLYLLCSGGRISPEVLYDCKGICLVSYKVAPSSEMGDLVVRLLTLIENVAKEAHIDVDSVIQRIRGPNRAR